MVILALDTTTRGGSVALWREGHVEVRAGDPSRTHAERLPGDLADIVTANGLTLADVELYAVASGPGSFTGMRVGIATIQGLALVHGRSVVAISALDVLARAAADRDAQAGREPYFVLSWMEAYRGEVFAALYRVVHAASDDTPPSVDALEPAAVGRPEDLAEAWASRLARETGIDPAGSALTVVGDAAPASTGLLRRAFGDEVAVIDAPPLAGTLAAMAAASSHEAVLPHAIVPVYVRRPDAVLGRERRAETSHPERVTSAS